MSIEHSTAWIALPTGPWHIVEWLSMRMHPTSLIQAPLYKSLTTPKLNHQPVSPW